MDTGASSTSNVKVAGRRFYGKERQNAVVLVSVALCCACCLRCGDMAHFSLEVLCGGKGTLGTHQTVARLTEALTEARDVLIGAGYSVRELDASLAATTEADRWQRHYGGDASVLFWQRIREQNDKTLYAIACDLQAAEDRFLSAVKATQEADQWSEPLLARVAVLEAEKARLTAVMREVVQTYGPWHDDDCPCDDTCDCSAKPLHDKVNAALAVTPEADQ